jgi:predicted metal-binding membrane protein
MRIASFAAAGLRLAGAAMSIAPAEPRIARRPSPDIVAVIAIGVLVLGAWVALVIEAIRLGGGTDAFVQALCRPSGATSSDVSGIAWDVAVAALLWMVMSVAMMLPTAVPMVLGFVDLVARRGGSSPRAEAAPVVLTAGYLSVWMLVSVAAAVLQVGAAQAASMLPLPPQAVTILAGALVGAAGLYQFSELKMAFLGACRHPLPALDRDFGLGFPTVLRLGIGQGVRCLGCCGPMMAIMLVAGAMNLAWMGIFAILMTVEKTTTGTLVPRAVGVLLLAAGAALAASAVGTGAIMAWMTRG